MCDEVRLVVVPLPPGLRPCALLESHCHQELVTFVDESSLAADPQGTLNEAARMLSVVRRQSLDVLARAG